MTTYSYKTRLKKEYERVMKNGMLMKARHSGENVEKVPEDAFMEFLDIAIEAINKQIEELDKDINVSSKIDGWISVDDRLPEEEGQYIVTTKFGIKISSFSNNLYKIDKYDFEHYKGKQRKGFYNYDSEYVYFEQDVLAWMPTPEPYKKGEC